MVISIITIKITNIEAIRKLMGMNLDNKIKRKAENEKIL